jgi:hypothetical protein
MTSASLALTLLAIAAAPTIEPGTQLTYAGTMVGVKDDGNPAVKKFTLTLVAASRIDDVTDLLWTLDETGRGGWTWLDSFGVSQAKGQLDVRPARIGRDGRDVVEPALLYERAEGKNIVPLLPPLIALPETLAKDTTWMEGPLTHRIAGEEAKAGRMCWEIDVRSPYGHKRTIWIDKDSSLVVAVNETVFIGQGEEHKLQFELTESKKLTADDWSKIIDSYIAWKDLRASLDWQPRSRREELTTEQLAKLKAELPKIVESAAAGPFAAIAEAAQADATGQKNRAGAVAALKAAILGKPLGELKLTDIAGKELPTTDWKDKIVVLHFWSYDGNVLAEPYGQVGYLDFLLRQRGDKGVKVVGVVVGDQLGDEHLRRAAAASARKFKAFMNLGYPLVIDDGSLLKKVGDPRIAGGKLPLFVVIGKDGNVAEYHAGNYEVKPNEGLAKLDAVVAKLLSQ